MTGAIGTDIIAGVVHGGEWVAPAWMVDQYPGLFGALEAMRVRGYQGGGHVGAPPLLGAELLRVGDTGSIWNKVKGPIESARTAVSDFVTQLTAGTDAIDENTQAQEVATEAAEATRSLWDRAKEMLGNIFSEVGAAMLAKAPIVNQVVQAFEAGGVTSAVVTLMASSERFNAIMEMVNSLLQMLADAFGAMLEPLMPLIGIVAVLAEGILPIIVSVFELLQPALKFLFEIVKVVALFILHVVKGIGNIWNGIIGAIQSVFRALGSISVLGWKPLGFLNSWADSLERAKMDTDGLSNAIDELNGLTWDSAKAKAEELRATKAVTEALINVPQALNLNLMRWRSAVASSISVESAATGGYIERGGLLNVHKGELVTPAHVVRRGESSDRKGGDIIVNMGIRNAYGVDDMERQFERAAVRGIRRALRKTGAATTGTVFSPV